MLQYNPKDMSVMEIQGFLTSGIGPRPIALVSTISEDGVPNLAPFSFFNAFGANPPTLVFSPARRGRDGTLKDTYYNAKATGECVVSIVSYDMVEQVSLSSTEYSSDVNEFDKSGFTMVESTCVKPAGIKESPFWMECKVNDIVSLGENNGSGNLVIAEIVMFHVNPNVLKDGKLDPDALDAVGRFGQNNYVRASGDSIFVVDKPTTKGIGMDALPQAFTESHIYSANNLARFANVLQLPTKEEVLQFKSSIETEPFDEYDFSRAEKLKQPSKMLALVLSAPSSKKLNSFIERTAKLFLETHQFEQAIRTAMIPVYV